MLGIAELRLERVHELLLLFRKRPTCVERAALNDGTSSLGIDRDRLVLGSAVDDARTHDDRSRRAQTAGVEHQALVFRAPGDERRRPDGRVFGDRRGSISQHPHTGRVYERGGFARCRAAGRGAK